MTSFRFEAARADGVLVSGVMDAESSARVSAVLAQRGLYPMAVAAAESERRPPASRRDLAVAFRSIAALVGAGVPLERAVASTVPLTRGALREALVIAREGLRQGRSFAAALEASRGVVPGVVIGMVRAGERGSQLGSALDAVAAHLEREAELIAKVRQALAYPLLLALFGSVSTLIIGIVVVPRFAALLADLGSEPSAATRMLLAGSAFLARYWLPLLIGVGGGVGGVGAWATSVAGRRRLHEALLDLPVIGSVRLELATARVTHALAGMLAAGMPLLAALDAAREATGDEAVAGRLGRVRDRVAQGRPLAESLEHERACAGPALQLVAVGESSGRLGEMARRAGDLAAQDAERGLRTLVGLLEPTLIVGFGGLVAFVAAALLQAVYAVRPM